jgi:hypothetical protein
VAKREGWPDKRGGQIGCGISYERDVQMEGVTRLEGWPNWSKEKEPSYGQMARQEGGHKREGWPDIRGVDRWEVVMREVKRWVVIYERDMARWKAWPDWRWL